MTVRATQRAEARGGDIVSELGRRLDQRRLVAVALGVAGVAAGARLPGLLRNAFWQDEVVSARVLLESSPVGMLRHVARTEATPPLWYALGWVGRLVGIGPEEYRGFSLVAGMALAFLLVVYARRLVPLAPAVAAGLLAALGWQFVKHGSELRAYAVFAALSVVFALLLVRTVEEPTPRRLTALGACVAAGTMTSYFFCLAVLAGLIWAIAEPTLRAVRPRVTLAIATGLVPLAVWSPVLVHQYLGQRFRWIGPFDLDRVVAGYWLLFARTTPDGRAAHYALSLGALLLVLLGAVALARTAPGRLCVLLALLPFAAEALLWAAGARIFDPRNLLGAGPFAAVAGVAALHRLPRPAALVALAALVLSLGVALGREESTPSTPYHRVAEALVAQGWTPDSPIAVFGDFFAFRGPLEWYLPGQPKLTLAEPRTGRCRAIYVVSPRRAPRPIGRVERVDSILVGQLGTTRVPRGRVWRRARLLAAVGAATPCARQVPESQITERLRP